MEQGKSIVKSYGIEENILFFTAIMKMFSNKHKKVNKVNFFPPLSSNLLYTHTTS